MMIDRISHIMNLYNNTRSTEKERYANTTITTLLENDDYLLMDGLLKAGFPPYTILSNNDVAVVTRIIDNKFHTASPTEMTIIYRSMLNWFPLFKLARQYPEAFTACMPYITDEAAGKLLSCSTPRDYDFLKTRYGLTSTHVCFHN